MVARLKDVAARAGVSVKTASNVVNDHPHISAGTRAKVERAIAELRYRPNISARQLKYGRTGFLALAIPRLDEPYFAQLAARISAQAEQHHLFVLHDITGGTLAGERAILDGVRSHVVDGVIFSPLAVTADDIAARPDGRPMILLGERATPTGYDHVAVDSVAAGEAVTRHLIGLGRRRIAAIGRESRHGTASVRLAGFQRALAQAGLDAPAELVRSVSGYAREDGRLAMHSLLELPEPPDAVFCFNDGLAIGALRACAERGVCVPDTVAIAGFDDIPEGRFVTPTLTTIAPDLDVLAAEVLRLLQRRTADPAAEAEQVSVPWALQIRESTTSRD